MATELQERLAEEIVKNKKRPRHLRKNKAQILVSAGYSAITAKANPKFIMEQKGVKDSLASFGLTEELITTSLVADIKNKPKKRVKELALGADILGMRKPDEKSTTTNNFLTIFSTQQQQRIAREIIVADTESERGSD